MHAGSHYQVDADAVGCAMTNPPSPNDHDLAKPRFHKSEIPTARVAVVKHTAQFYLKTAAQRLPELPNLARA